jgi:hypothetical protein
VSRGSDARSRVRVIFEPERAFGARSEARNIAGNAAGMQRSASQALQPRALSYRNDETMPAPLMRVRSSRLSGKAARAACCVFLNDARDERLDFLSIDVISAGREHRLLPGRLRQDLT